MSDNVGAYAFIIRTWSIQIFAATEADAKLWCTTGFFSVVNEHVRETNQFW